MEIKVCGLDYRSSSLSERRDIYSRIRSTSAVNRNLFVTCNRLESYGYQDVPLFDSSYYYKGECQVLGHLLALACGLRSQLLGERQIIDQLEKFSAQAEPYLSGLINKAVFESRKIRKDFSLNTGNTVADAVFNHVNKQGRLGSKTVVVGTGAVARLIGCRFNGFSSLCFVSGKNIAMARKLAAEYSAEAFDRKDIRSAVYGAKVLICATDSPHYVITPDHGVCDCLIYDLSSPQRNIHPVLNAVGLEGLSGEFDSLNEALRERVLCADELIRGKYNI